MNTADLQEFIKNRPSILSFEDEVEVISSLSTLSNDQILSSWESFTEILDRVYDSHADNGVFHVASDNRSFFLTFASWLRSKNADLFGGKESELTSLADLVSSEFNG